MSMPEREDVRDPSEVRSELRRITASPEFRSAERLTRMLAHVVEQTLLGNTDRLKEIVLGVEVFDRRDFDPRVDPIVRVEASRLRKRLDDFYRRSGCPSGVMIVLPKGTYAASFEHSDLASAAADPGRRPGKIRVAVVPVGADNSTGVCLADGLIHGLTRCARLEVALWILECKSESEAIPAAKDLGVQYLISVTARNAYTALRVIDVRAGSYVWSEHLEGSNPEPAALIPRILEALTRHEPESGGPPAKHVNGAAAYNLYLKGRYYWNLRSEAGLWKAVEFFEQAIAHDAECALACTGLADAYTLLANYGASAPSEVRPKAKEFALRAVQIDPRLAEAHTSLAHVHATYEWDWQTAELEYLTAIRLNPSYATSHHWYGITLLAPLRRLGEALEEIRRARECDAISLSIRRDEALVQLYQNDAEVALASATGSADDVVDEIADLAYHLTVLMEARGLSWTDIAARLKERHKP